MTGELITYKAPNNNRLTIEKCLELQQWILDPSSRQYVDNNSNSNQALHTQELHTHSAVKQIEKKLTTEQALEIQKKIIGD